MGDINPQIDLVYVCFLQGRVYNPLKNRKFHEVSAGIPCVAWEKSRYGKVRGFARLTEKRPHNSGSDQPADAGGDGKMRVFGVGGIGFFKKVRGLLISRRVDNFLPETGICAN